MNYFYGMEERLIRWDKKLKAWGKKRKRQSKRKEHCENGVRRRKSSLNALFRRKHFRSTTKKYLEIR